MEHEKCYFVECPENIDTESFHLLGGADTDGDYYEGDYEYEGDEGDEPAKKPAFSCMTRKSKSPGKSSCPLCFNMYFQPYSSKSIMYMSIYGTNYNGVNLFGVYFWGFILTYLHEGIFLLLSQMFKSRTKILHYGKGPRWQFTELNYKSTTGFYFTLYSVLVGVYLLFSGVRLRCLKDTEQKNQFVGSLFTTVLLLLTFVPAAFAGNAWENELFLVRSSDPAEFFEYQGWIVLVIVPLLWPIICSCFVVVFAVFGSIYAILCIKVRKSDVNDEDDDYDYEGDSAYEDDE